MGRTNRVDRKDLPPSPRPWFTMDSAPKDGSRVELWIPYTAGTEEACADAGHWDAEVQHRAHRRDEAGVFQLVVIGKGCWRFDGDDGAFDIQPTAWRPLQRS